MIPPTVGRVVHFYEWRGHAEGHNGPLAALVAAVHDDRCITVMVVTRSGLPVPMPSVRLLQDDDKPPETSYCAWMDYQKGQAAKAEALEKELAAKPR